MSEIAIERECLFVGGPLDGQLRYIENPCPYFEAIEWQKQRVFLMDHPIDEIPTFNRVEYELVGFRIGETEVLFYVIKGMSPYQAMQRLRKVYAEAKGKKGDLS